MRLQSPPNIIELEIVELIPGGLPMAGDLHIEVKASVNAYVGWGDCWIEAPKFQQFASALRRLYNSHEGIARVESMSPGEFMLSFGPVNSRGYVGVKISLSRLSPPVVSMSGAFEIELAALSPIVAWAENPKLSETSP